MQPTLKLESALPQATAAPATTPAAPPSTGTILTDADLRQIERGSIVAALDRSGGRVAGQGGAAELLGISPSTLRDRMRALGIERKAAS
jgi:transcriptional regulator with GAF, ATPase, and Fis domain